MKRCPECDSSFPDTDKFCELDGAQLVADYSENDSSLLIQPASVDPQPSSPPELLEAGVYQHSIETRPGLNWRVLTVAVAGVAIGVFLFIVPADNA